jgi:5'-nucleotidase
MLRILLTNDDGIDAPGLAALARAVADLGDLRVAAPLNPQTGSGHGITVRDPMVVRPVTLRDGVSGWSIDARPADCVKLAMIELLGERPDFVISGINEGLNTARYVMYSGTVAAAAEATAFFGVPSMAVSLQFGRPMDYDAAARIARRLFERFRDARPTGDICLNVNVPGISNGVPRGVRVCPTSRVVTDATYRREERPDGSVAFVFAGRDPVLRGEAGSDAQAVADGYVAITPMDLLGTDEAALAGMASWDWPRVIE